MALTHWFTSYDPFGFPIENANLGGCGLFVTFLNGEWQWLVSHAGREVYEGAARSCRGAKQQAEDAARRFLDVVARLPRAA